MIRTMIALLAMTSLATVAQASHLTRDLNLVNSSRTTVASFFASHAGTDQWDADLLSRRAGCNPITSCNSTWTIRPVTAATTSSWCSPTEPA